VFNGANINENINVSANGSRVRLTRDVGNVTMDVNGMETLGINASGGTDTITVNDLSGTGVGKVNIDLAAGGTVNGDGAVDTIVINATDGDDAITVNNDNGVVTVSGLGADIVISHFDANDRLVINGRGGDDVIEATGLTGMLLTADGGDGDDVLIGSPGSDILRGGNGDDVLIGNGGQDALDGGPGDNTVIASLTAAPQFASVSLLGQFMASSFVPPGFGQGGAPITEQASNQHPLLSQPHA
jgi:Ca2+-binding RTX toxin-like protein